MTDAPTLSAAPEPAQDDTTTTPRRKRRFRGIGPLHDEPKVRKLALDGKRAVAVQLSGRHGDGKEMIHDASMWQVVALSLGPRWVLLPAGSIRADGHRWFAVASGRREVVPFARQSGGKPTLVLARWIIGAKRGQPVFYKNGDFLDLRLSNLSLDVVRRVAPGPLTADPEPAIVPSSGIPEHDKEALASAIATGAALATMHITRSLPHGV